MISHFSAAADSKRILLTAKERRFLNDLSEFELRFMRGRRVRSKMASYALRKIGGWSASDFQSSLRTLTEKGVIGQSHQKQHFWLIVESAPPPTPPKKQCAYCGLNLKPERQTIDHVIPRCRGGKDIPENRVVACHECNQAKGARTPEEWASDILHYGSNRRSRTRLFRFCLIGVILARKICFLGQKGRRICN